MNPTPQRLLRFLVPLGALVLALLHPIAPATAAPTADPPSPPTIRIIEQNHAVGPNGTFYAYLDVLDAPAGAELAVDLYEAIDDTDDLEAALAGEPRRARATYDVVPLADQPTASQASGFSIRLLDGNGSPPDPGTWTSRMNEPGIHPIRIRLRGPDGTELGHVVTFLRRTVAGTPARTEPILDTIPILDLASAVPDDPDDREAIRRIIDVFLRHPDVPVGLHLGPDTVSALRADPAIAVALDDLVRRDTVEVLSSPFVPIDPQELVEEGFAQSIHDQIDLGRRALDTEIGRAGSSTTLLRTAIDDDTAAILRRAGLKRAIVTDRVIDSPPTGGPVRLGAATDVPVAIGSNLITPPIGPVADPTLTVTHLVTNAIARTELDGRHGTTAVLVDSRTDPQLTDDLLDRLTDADTPTRTLLPVEAFGNGPFPAAALRPTRSQPSAVYTRERLEIEALHRSHRAMLPDDTPVDVDFEMAMARTASSDLTEPARLARLDALRRTITATFGEITTSETERITLGARDAHIPISFTSTAGEPRRILIHLEASDRLEFPRDTIEAVLGPEQRTIVEVPVRSLTTGDTPMTITVTTPDGRIPIASARYTIRSTAVSGVGVVLTVGAAGFLIVWWSRHILRSRRERRTGADRRTKM